jgi:polysaccharide biosynthesis transport protein
MGRLLEALKQAETQRPSPRLATPPAIAPAAEEAALPEAAETEIPFIEWGPRKSMEASPSVLAAPAVRSIGPRIKDETDVVLVAPPHSVQFRAVPATKPMAKIAPELIAFHNPGHAVSTQYRELLQAILAGRPVDESQAFLFTAAHAGNGTTTTLLNAAITAARLGRRRVAVVDANLLKPALASALGLPEKPGLREVLAGVAALDEALQETAQPDLTALTAGVIQATGGIRFMAATIRSLLRQLRQRFDLIFVDAAAWDGRSETANLATICDAVYLVLSPNETDTPEIDELFRHIPEKGVKLAGCIISGAGGKS